MWRLVLTVSLLCCSAEDSVTCRDENGGEVDWFILYKAPYQKKVTTGLEFIHIYPQGSQIKSGTNTKPINHHEGILANTLKPMFDVGNTKPKDFGFISYNDQPPDGGCRAGPNYGHSKGVVMLDKTSGVWLLHSTPRFPKTRDQNFWPDSGSKNAQTFICVTFPYNEFKKIGEHLQYIKAYLFEHHIPADFHDELQKVVKKKDHLKPSSDFQDLKLNERLMFRSIAKQLLVEERLAKKPKLDPNTQDVNRVGDADLYVAILKETGSSLKVQSWGCQSGRVKNTWSNGIQYIKNVECLKTELGNWKPTKDHSKWCVTTDQNKAYTCFADVNRSQSQFERPGGALCIKSEEIRNIFDGFIDTADHCIDQNKVGVATKADPVSDCVYDPDSDCH